MAIPISTGAAQWVDAAYRQFVESGLASVRVEALARDLGTSKGSFYWHFASRSELIDAVMQRWEELETAQAIAIAQTSGRPEDRLRRLFDAVAARSSMQKGETALYVEAIAEGAASAVVHVSRRRIDYIAGILVELGFAPAEAERRATMTLASVLGLLQLRSLQTDQLAVLSDKLLLRTAFDMTIAPEPSEAYDCDRPGHTPLASPGANTSSVEMV